MNVMTNKIAGSGIISVLVLSTLFAFSPIAHAQYAGDGGCCGDYSTGYDYSTPYDYSTSYDYSTPYDYSTSYDYTTPYDYSTGYDYSTPYNYSTSYDYSTPYDYTTPYDYSTSYDYSTPYDYSTGYGGYDYGNTASPIYSYGTPSYGGIGGFGGYSTGGGYYIPPARPVYEPIPTWPTMPRYTATPSHSNTYNNNNQYVDHTPIPTWPTTTHVTATATGGSSNQEQQQNQTNHQANSQVLSSTHTQTQNNPVTVTQNQAPISNTNINNINIPAPVYQAPNQFAINYNFAQNYMLPTCTISVSNSYYNSYSNNPVTLTWSSTNAFSASISPNVGTVNPNGSTTVYPVGGTTIYTLTVHGQGGSNTCQTQVIYQQQPPVYQPPAYVPPVYVPPQVPTKPYVSLTQIPYTGFDFGPIGNAIYWAGLLSFALAASYLALYYKGGLAFASGTVRSNRQEVKRSHVAAVKATATPVTMTETPAVAQKTSFADLPTRGEYRDSTADTMIIKLAQNADEMPRITITRA
ncbi:hypothetical protein HZC00_01395 [Candidatus Kaiserbacteria bacterium]|nr:hypothetical protein [Candidatus Kaiserbacteria bacterium]